MFKWKDEDPVKRRLKLQLPQFSLSDIETRNCTEEDENGTFCCHEVKPSQRDCLIFETFIGFESHFENFKF